MSICPAVGRLFKMNNRHPNVISITGTLYLTGILGRPKQVVERSRDWFTQALRDLEHAENDVRGGFYDWACFSAQQAAEKGVKAALQKLGAEAWGHSVASLLEALPQKPPANLLDHALELDKAYIPARYPNAHPSGAPHQLYVEAEARRLIGYAREIIKHCESLLS
jgi:HEPN domain-containing protein